MEPPEVCNEPERLRALMRYHILDTGAEQDFDDLTRLAAYVTECPMAAISFLDSHRQWFKSRAGLAMSQIPSERSVCIHALLEEGNSLVIEDTFSDPRLKEALLLQQNPPVRFYAGAVLKTPEGHRIGTLCALDHRPRSIRPDQLEMLEALARQTMGQLSLRLAASVEGQAREDARQRETHLQLQYELSRIFTHPHEDHLATVLEAICSLLKWDAGAIWVQDEEEGLLKLARRHSRRPGGFPKFAAATDAQSFREGEGLPGRIWRQRGPLSFEDITQVSGFPRLEAAAEENLRSYFGFPVLREDGEVIGVLEFFSQKRQAPDENIMAALRSFSEQVAHYLERQRTTRELVASKQLHEAILNASLDAIVTIDGQGRVLEFNPAAEALFGYSRDIACGRQMSDLIVPPQHRDSHSRGMLRYLATGEARVLNRRIEITAINAGGEEFPIELAIVAIGQRPKVKFTAFIRDIRDRRALERHREELNRDLEAKVQERTRALAESNAQLEAFGYSVAHDLRAPLRSISGFAEVIQEDFGAVLPSQGIDYLQRIKASARRLDALIQDLLGYSRLGKIELPLGPVDLDSVLAKAFATLAGPIRQSGAAIEVEEPLGMVIANAFALEQVLENLLSNAVKFTKHGEAPRVRIWSEAEAGSRRLFVQDQGIGIHPEHQEKVFKLFERVATDYPGTGVGLAIVSQVLRRMGGASGLQSELGKGTTFWISLPALG